MRLLQWQQPDKGSTPLDRTAQVRCPGCGLDHAAGKAKAGPHSHGHPSCTQQTTTASAAHGCEQMQNQNC
jgi:hypothetical protein